MSNEHAALKYIVAGPLRSAFTSERVCLGYLTRCRIDKQINAGNFNNLVYPIAEHLYK